MLMRFRATLEGGALWLKRIVTFTRNPFPIIPLMLRLRPNSRYCVAECREKTGSITPRRPDRGTTPEQSLYSLASISLVF
jgi:hypothetical protein